VTNVKECSLDIICGKSNQVEDAKATASQVRKQQEAYEDDRYLERFETLEDRTKKIENKIDRILNLIDERKGNQVADSVSILPSSDNSLSDSGIKDLFILIRNFISQQQESMVKKIKESIAQQMKSQKESISQQMKSQKESIAQQMKSQKESIAQQMKSQKESIDEQMKSQKESIDQQNRGMIELSNQMKLQKESIDKQNGCIHELAKQMVKIKNKLKTEKADKSSED